MTTPDDIRMAPMRVNLHGSPEGDLKVSVDLEKSNVTITMRVSQMDPEGADLDELYTVLLHINEVLDHIFDPSNTEPYAVFDFRPVNP